MVVACFCWLSVHEASCHRGVLPCSSVSVEHGGGGVHEHGEKGHGHDEDEHDASSHGHFTGAIGFLKTCVSDDISTVAAFTAVQSYDSAVGREAPASSYHLVEHVCCSIPICQSAQTLLL